MHLHVCSAAARTQFMLKSVSICVTLMQLSDFQKTLEHAEKIAQFNFKLKGKVVVY